jgi:hypothetical protein
MARNVVHLALFEEDQLDEAAEAIQKLRDLGIPDKDVTVISGTPFSEKMLGRPMAWTRVPAIALSGAVVGFLTALFLNFGTPLLYPIRVGGMAYQTLPTSFVIIFELTMLGLLISTFLGVFVETISPSYGPQGYDPRITDGHIGILFNGTPDLDPQLHEALSGLGAEIIHGAEAKKLWLF